MVYDPKVSKETIYADLEYLGNKSREEIEKLVTVVNDPIEAAKDAHAIAVLTEWDEFKEYDWQAIHDLMLKPAFVFDGRRILDHKKMEALGFKFYKIGQNGS